MRLVEDDQQYQQSAMEGKGSNAAPFKNTWPRRYATLLAHRLAARTSLNLGGAVIVPPRFVIKAGSFKDLSEASTMRFVAQRTSIPVPKVYCSFKHKDITFIVMRRVRGQMLIGGPDSTAVSWKQRSSESRAKILTQLRDMVDEMRSLSPPSDGKVANVDGGSLWECRLPGGTGRFGPFEDVAAFHLHLRKGMPSPPHPDQLEEVKDLIARQEKGSWPLRFTHGDLSSFNILVRGDEVVGVLDWETAGWFPSYWEYTTAWNVSPMNEFWRDEVGKFIEPFPEELEMERVRRKYFGDY